ncbi:PepSY domain-containing protein [Brevirhabdus sp.]|uniref:PepSY domain-containing protein n=1 Tax=Brevirhabdus sp. TaxID=2004514 RepID=UPI0040583225
MWRALHTWLGLGSLVLVVVLALGGSALSLRPVLDSLAPQAQSAAGQSVADLLGKMDLAGLEMDRLLRSPSGALKASYFDATGAPRKSWVDQATGAFAGPVEPGNPLWVTLKDFHRALFLRDSGRMITGIGALALALVSLAGVIVLAARMGGLARIFGRVQGKPAARWHSALSRILIVPLLLSSLTGFYMVLTDLGVLPVAQIESVQFPESTQGLPAVAPGTLHGLAEIPLKSLRELQFPFAGDTRDVFTVTTDAGLTIIDQFTGDVLEAVPATTSMKIHEWFYAVHTGEGLAIVGLLLGIAALGVPVLGITGVVIWWGRRRRKLRIPDNRPAAVADIVLLVGSEGGTTWGFARTLHRDLTAAGHKVHSSAMNAFRDHYKMASHVIVLTSTYGNGTAPASADRFLARLADMADRPAWSYAVLGFGDRAFAHYCQFAKDVDAALDAQGIRRALEPALINRQSPQAFATWGNDLARILGTTLTLRHEIELPPTEELTLISRTLYGEDVQAPTAVLRFRRDAGPRPAAWRRLLGAGRAPVFGPGDLLGILPPGSQVPRYYSLSSAASADVAEICVRRQIGGECSGMLHAMEPGDTISAFVKENPEFSPVPGGKPVIMVSAGTGIAPFVGMIRSNAARRELHLFWGGRSRRSDFLYEDTLNQCLEADRLARLETAFSRDHDRAYVQDKLRGDAERLVALLRAGASVMVCGGDAMAQAVATEFDTLLAPLGLSTHQLKARKLYLEDIF